MADRFPCPVCGEPQEHMTLPRSWPAELVATWRQLERNMPCESPTCPGVALPDARDD